MRRLLLMPVLSLGCAPEPAESVDPTAVPASVEVALAAPSTVSAPDSYETVDPIARAATPDPAIHSVLGTGEGLEHLLDHAPGGASVASPPSGVHVSVGAPAVTGGKVGNADAVVAGMNAGFKRCYQRALADDPTMKGALWLDAKLGPNGEVVAVSTAVGAGLSDTLSDSLKSCAKALVTSRGFAPPEGGGASVRFSVTFQTAK